jgi:hypothetical protein
MWVKFLSSPPTGGDGGGDLNFGLRIRKLNKD